MSLTPEQQAAAYAPCSVVITAGAGTGKTHMLAERYLYYLREKKLSPLEVVAVTFTEKAATELRSRIRALVTQQLPQRLDLLAELEAAEINTIHALSARICTEHFQLIDIPADFQVLDSLEGQVWLSDGFKKALSNLPLEVFQAIPHSLLQEILNKLLDDPYTASKALRRGIQDWSKLITQAAIEAVEMIANDPTWQSSRSLLEQHQGKEGDKLETIRISVLEAMKDLEDAKKIKTAVATIDGVNLRVGSKKNWQDDSFKAVKDALKALRANVRRVTSQGLLDLELGDADEQLKSILPGLSEAYSEVTSDLSRLKLQNKLLTFSDLEIYALQALTHTQVQNYYQQRWQAFLVDEFQDTNPTQAELLDTLTAKAELTIVGDIKQSIYGFRRADIRVFQQFRDRILSNGGKEVILSTSFRTHQTLINRFNQIFTPLLGDNHQDLTAFRRATPIEGEAGEKFNYLQVLTVGDPFQPEGEAKPPKPNKAQRQRVEAYNLADRIKQMLNNKTPVFDKQTKQTRPIQPKDIAILTRTWQPLEIYSAAISAMGIPVAPAGGGNLLATREAKDANILLRFLANPRDDIALVAVLRSPFFAISDRLLFQIRQAFERQDRDTDSCWWEEIQKSSLPELEYPIKALNQLLRLHKFHTPSRILQICDRLTGYTAVLANLAGAERRLADWQGFQRLVKDLEQGNYDLFAVVRRLKRLDDEEVAIPRPVLAISNAVSLMTIYASKGLEWALVIVADLSKERPKSHPPVYFDPQLGVAVKSKNSVGEIQKPVLYSWLEYLQDKKERAEAYRVLYVALTRARDYLFLSAAEPYKGELNRLQRGLTAANIPIFTIPYTDAKALPPILPTPPVAEYLPPLLLNSVGSGLSQLPVTALTDYARCPQRFKLHLLDGHPGIGEGLASGMQIGTLVHKALENNLTQAKQLISYAEGEWNREIFNTAIALAHKFFQLPMYEYFRNTAIAKEQQVSLQLGKITFNGVIDLVGNNWILDYKSDRTIQPEDHRFQLWVYAKALQNPNAHIAYLRHDRIHSFTESELNAIAPEVISLAENIYRGNYTATPTMEKCAVCPYLACCHDAMI
ncbi:UvrD-helicase domain-containing protein [Waterburya agarophytonicola K14]|uniref:DNA 3'-5' helicase n=1 Tax=Waterburya agarophytonicola KI4 TaxID=2874699 RepID=A0A964FG65_9CYAN|nr:UvrD-helicase domain-containing protein [Waterburya agarophytonicola]MCC0176264.1 UvrD-helicase domain-containing protein [Waterburya agarophytonicola KI4]